jgi:ABC-2 type transport system ATP-binding protein
MIQPGQGQDQAVEMTGAQPAPVPTQSSSLIAPSSPVLLASGVSRWFGAVVAVSDVSFAVGPGITGLLGPNGAGKTTLLRMLSGLLSPSRGQIQVLGQAVRGNPAIFRHITLIMDKDAVYPFLTAREFVRLNAHLQGIHDEARVQAVLDTVELTDAADRAIGGFSKGMRQRARLAAGLVHDPQVLLLDEPFSGADPRQRMHLMALVRRLAAEGRTILFSSHILEEVEQLAHEVLVITHGKLAAAGDVRALRRAMTDRPHRVRIRAADPRALAAALIVEPVISGVELSEDGNLVVQAAELGRCALAIPRVARAAAVRLFEVVPEDESLERVFAYLVGTSPA